jgi:hypothetical protein
MPRWWPIATASVLAVTAVLTVLRYRFPQLGLAPWRLTAGRPGPEGR